MIDFAVPADGEAGGWGEHVDLLESDGEESLEFEGGRGGGGVSDLVDGAGRRAGGCVFEGGGDPAGVGVGEADAVGVAVVGVRIGRDLADPGLGGPGGAGVGREVEAALGGDEAVAGGGAVDVVLDEVVGDVDRREVEAVGGAEDEVEGGAGEDGVGGAGPVGGVEEAAIVAAVGVVKGVGGGPGGAAVGGAQDGAVATDDPAGVGVLAVDVGEEGLEERLAVGGDLRPGLAAVGGLVHEGGAGGGGPLGAANGEANGWAGEVDGPHLRRRRHLTHRVRQGPTGGGRGRRIRARLRPLCICPGQLDSDQGNKRDRNACFQHNRLLHESCSPLISVIRLLKPCRSR